jgi:N12 class adenine-specific DNA methylase
VICSLRTRADKRRYPVASRVFEAGSRLSIPASSQLIDNNDGTVSLKRHKSDAFSASHVVVVDNLKPVGDDTALPAHAHRVDKPYAQMHI